MVKVELKPLIERLNRCTRQALEGSVGVCMSRGHYEITTEHLLLRLLENADCDLALMLRRARGGDSQALQRALERSLEGLRDGNTGRPVFSPLLTDLLQDAWLLASIDLSAPQIRSGALLIAYVERLRATQSGGYPDVIRHLNPGLLREQFDSLCEHSCEIPVAAGVSAMPADAPSGAANPDQRNALSQFCDDVTARARAGQIDPVFGRDAEIRQTIDILTRRRKNNPICVGEPGVGKTAVVEGLALRIVTGDVPDVLREARLVALDLGLLQAGASVKGEFESRLKCVITEIQGSPTPIILFIDEAHMLVGAGGSAGLADAANLLKPALARGELRTIAATTWAEYKKYFETDAALARRFQPVRLHEPDIATATLILRGLKARYEQVHGVIVHDSAIEAAVQMSQRFIAGRQLPDKAIDLLDTACARVKLLQSGRPAALEDATRRIQALHREQQALQRDQDYHQPVSSSRQAEIIQQLERLAASTAALESQWIQQREAGQALLVARAALHEALGQNADETVLAMHRDTVVQADCAFAPLQGEEPLVRVDVDVEVIARVISDWTGIPQGKVRRERAESVLQLADTLALRVCGQDHAMARIADGLRTSAAGLQDPHQPMGVFLLVGPSGVGKTETALCVADALFGDERSMVTVNMSEFQERHSISRLIGSPPGYVGYGEGGVLTEAVRQRPYCAVLLDEMEKAHPDVLNLFYQVFDRGMLADGQGNEIDFSSTVIFLTSNLGSDIITEMTAGTSQPSPESVSQAVRPLLSAHLQPALLARVTVIPYYALASQALEIIVRKKLSRVAQRLDSQAGLNLSCTDEVVQRMVARCTEVQSGARNIDFILRDTILPLLSDTVLRSTGKNNMAGALCLDVDSGGAFIARLE